MRAAKIGLAVLLGALLLWGAALLHGGRYGLVPITEGGAYRLDRWTGAVSLCVGARDCRPVPERP